MTQLNYPSFILIDFEKNINKEFCHCVYLTEHMFWGEVDMRKNTIIEHDTFKQIIQYKEAVTGSESKESFKNGTFKFHYYCNR